MGATIDFVEDAPEIDFVPDAETEETPPVDFQPDPAPAAPAEVAPPATRSPGDSIRATPTFRGELLAGRMAPAASIAYEALRRPFSGLIGPTESERSEGMIPFGENPDGTPKYQYKPLGDRMAREAGLMTPFFEIPHLEANADDGTLKAVAKGVFNVGAGLVGGFASPLGAVLPGAGEVPAIARAGAGLFGADMLAHIPAQVIQAATAPTVQERVEGGVGAATGAAMGALATRHAIASPKSAAAPVARAVDDAGTTAPVITIEPEAIRPTPEPPPVPPAPEATPVEAPVPPVVLAAAEKLESVGAPATAEALLKKAEEAAKPKEPEPAPAEEASAKIPRAENVEEIHRPEVELLNDLLGRKTAEPAANPAPVQEELPVGGNSRAPEPASAAPTAAAAEPLKETKVQGLQTEEVPIAQLKLSSDVPQFKKGADAAGVVEKLEGKYDRTGVGPIQIWRRLDGSLEVISGRHRFDLAQRAGEETIPGQIHDEAKGFTQQMAATLDAELNIRDGQGSAADYANYFRNSGLPEADASARGLLARAKGRDGLGIATRASEDVFALHQSGRLTDAQASGIANAAPGNDGAQRLGTRAIFAGESIADARNTIQAALSEAGRRKSTQGDFFSDTALEDGWKAQANIASKYQRELRDQISAVEGAAKRPEKARELGVDVKDPDGVKKRIEQLRAEQARWEKWSSHPDLLAITRGEEPSQLPKLRRGEKQGDLLSGQTEDLSLVGEKGIDFDKAAKEEAEAARIQAENDAANDANQGKFFSKSPKTPEAELVEKLRASHAKAPSEADLVSPPQSIEFQRPGSAAKIIVQNTKEALAKLIDRYAPKGEEKLGQYEAEAAELAKSAPGLTVKVWRNESALPAELKARIDPAAIHEGFIDTASKTVHLFSDNLRDVNRLREVFAHETTGHYGVQSILPYDSPVWQNIADTVFKTAPGAANDIIRSYIKKHPRDLTPGDRAKIASEYVARLAERPATNPGVWKEIVQAVRTALRKLGIVREWSEADIRDLVRRAGKEVNKGAEAGGSEVRASVKDLGKEVEERSPYALKIEEAFRAAVPDEASRARVDAYVKAKLAGEEAPSLSPGEASTAEQFLTYFRGKQAFAKANGVAGALQDAYEAALNAHPSMDLTDRLATYSSEANRLVNERTTAKTPPPTPGAGESTPTSTQNAVVDAERTARGLPPAMEPARREFGTVWDDAMREIHAAGTDANPGKDLVEAIENGDKKQLTDTENAILLHRQITLQNEFDRAARATVEASERGDGAAATTGRIQSAILSDELLRLYNAGKRAGTEAGRGLNIRKMLRNEDYSAATMEIRKRAANGGRKLTEDEAADVAKQAKQIELLSEEEIAATAKAEVTAAVNTAEDALKEVVAKVKPTRAPKVKKAPSEVPELSAKTKSWLEKQAAAARERIRARGGKLNVGIDPAALVDQVIVAAADIAGGLRDFTGWASAKIKELGEDYAPHLQDIWDRANALINQHESVVAVASKAAARVKEGASLKQVRPYIQKVAEALVRAGVTDLEPLLDQLHPLVEDILPGTTRREVMDAFSGYGEFRPLDKGALKTQLRDLRGQAQQTGKILDMQEGEAPKKTGPERRTPSDKERALIKQVEQLKREGNYRVTDPDAQLRTAMQAIKTRLRNAVSDLTSYLETGDRPPEKSAVQYDAEATDLRLEVQALRQLVEEIDGKPGMTEEQRIAATEKALQRAIDEYGRRIDEKDFSSRKGGRKVESPNIDRLRAERDALRAEFQEVRALSPEVAAQRAAAREADLAKQIAKLDDKIASGDYSKPGAKPGEPSQRAEDLSLERDVLRRELDERTRDANKVVLTDEQIQAAKDARALRAYMTRTAQRTAELTRKLAAGDFAKAPRRVLHLDEKALRAQADLQRAKTEFDRGLLLDRLSKRGVVERTLDGAAKWRRAFVLSGFHTIFKLASAATEIIGFSPVEEAVGGVFGKLPILSRVAERAPRQGGFNLNAEVKAISANFKNVFRDVGDYLIKGGLDLDEVYGQAHLYPFEWKEVVGRIHGALKTPARRNEFTRAFEKRLQYEARQGNDPSDPMIQTRVAAQAYADANKSIFMEDNMIVDGYKRLMSRFAQPEKSTGQPSLKGKVAETTLKVILPVIRIPTNIVARTFEYTFGALTGSVRLAKALRKGIDNLPPEDADLIMQNLKRGSMGAALLTLGILSPDSFQAGGYYTGKRKDDDVPAGGLRVGGHDLPKYLVHHPLLETLQIGATIRRVADSKMRKRDKETQGYGAGAVAAFLGLGKQVPFIDAITRTGEAIQNQETLNKYAADMAESVIVPQGVREVAGIMDHDDRTGKPTRRKPSGVIETVKTGIPGLRETVPKKR